MPPESGATPSPAQSAEGDTVLFRRTLRRVRSEENAGHSTGKAGTTGPLRPAKARSPRPPVFRPAAGAPASPGALPSERRVEGQPPTRVGRCGASRDPVPRGFEPAGERYAHRWIHRPLTVPAY